MGQRKTPAFGVVDTAILGSHLHLVHGMELYDVVYYHWLMISLDRIVVVEVVAAAGESDVENVGTGSVQRGLAHHGY